MNFSLDYHQLSTLPVMCITAVGFAIGWGIILEVSKKKIYDSLPYTEWWHRAIHPTQSMMANFGYPKEPTNKFPNAMTEPMARDFYAFLVTICSQHFVTALMMLPILMYGWEESSNAVKSLFILGTLSDVGFDIYDTAKSSMRTFTNHPDPLPLDFWIILVVLHHTTALFLVLPMNINYIDRAEYHQTAVSLLMAASLCYAAGCYKFALDIGKKKKDFLLYKFLVIFQLCVILYTRVYLWFPAAISFRAHLKEQNDTTFLYCASFILSLLSLFNLMLVADGVMAAGKCIPKKFPKTEAEEKKTVRALHRASGGIDAPDLAFVAEFSSLMARRKFRGAVHSVIAANKMSSSMSSSVGGHGGVGGLNGKKDD